MRASRQSRIIPAYAGSTCHGATVEGSTRDHPRIRGEHSSSMAYCILRSGIIPAYAGSTASGPAWRPQFGDHPRIRGEHTPACAIPSCPTGSSPHTRGARSGIPSHRIRVRIIPAYAGSTRCTSSLLPSRYGSSPHTRGALMAPRRLLAAAGIIPAYAGSTGGISAGFSEAWDHPRIRGEHGVPEFQAGGGAGSSPHTRGAPSWRRGDFVLLRIIPAYAGSTAPPPQARRSGPDHPRIRGEHCLAS